MNTRSRDKCAFSNMKAKLEKSENDLLSRGIPKEFLVYCIRNGPSNGKMDPVHGTTGIWMYSMQEALSHLKENAEMFPEVEYDCIVIDGTKLNEMKVHMLGAIQCDEEGWKKHKMLMKERAYQQKVKAKSYLRSQEQ